MVKTSEKRFFLTVCVKPFYLVGGGGSPPPPEKIIKLLFQSGRSKGHNHHQQLKTKNKLVPVDL